MINRKVIENFEKKPDEKDIYQIANDNKLIFPKRLLYTYFKPLQVKDKSTIPIRNDNKIFVSIAFYRDVQCSKTLMDIINKADRPQNLVICICQQNSEDDIPCVELPKINSNAVIKLIKLSEKEARGPCWARYLIQQEWNGEEYFLQIDSHTRFVEGWDTKCINNLTRAKELAQCNVCLSNYVSTFNLETEEIEVNPLRGPLFIESIDSSNGFLKITSNYIDKMDEPMESIGWSACYSFSSSQLIKDAPYDPYTPFLFFGEEMDIFARLYTRGWLMYVPKEPICFTSFDRSYRKTFWEHPDESSVLPITRYRLYYRFGVLTGENKNKVPKEILRDIEKYSLGDKKTFEEFYKYCMK